MCFRPKSIPASAARRAATLAHRPTAPDLTVDAAIGLWLDSLIDRGTAESTVLVLAASARLYFAAALTEPLRSMTPLLMRHLADDVTQHRSKTGRPLAPVKRHNVYQTARRFLRWCVAEGRLPADPMAAADPIALAELQAEIIKLRKELDETRTAACGEGCTMTAPTKPDEPTEPPHVGEIVWLLREAGKLTRRELSKQTGIAPATIKNIEHARHRPTAATIRKLLTAPCMATLPVKVKQAGLSLGLGDNGIGEK